MKPIELKIARIGNSRGVRIPADVLRRHAFSDTVLLVESVDGILLRPKNQTETKLSWADTAKAMAASSEEWSEWDAVAADGLDGVPWENEAVAEEHTRYKTAQRKAKRRQS